MRSDKKAGRKAGSRNRGFYYKAGRGWHGRLDGKYVLLRGADGEKIILRNTPLSVLEDAQQRLLSQRRMVEAGSLVTVEHVCAAYLASSQKANRKNTYDVRSRLLFNFIYGLPARFRKCPEQARTKDKLHKGYGALLACDLTHRDIADWCNANKGWKSHRMARQAVKRAFSWAASEDVLLIPSNPLAKLKIPAAKKRITYFTPEQEKALCQHSKPEVAAFIRVLIRTGCRPGELRTITAGHLEKTSRGMVLRLKASEHKTGSHKGKERLVRVAEELQPLFRKLASQHSTGPLFRNTQGKPWTEAALRCVFARLKRRLIKKWIALDEGACFYTCRHTFAKRVLGGYWTNKPATIEQLCALMGNSREVAWEHYGQWCESYDDPLWKALEIEQATIETL